MLVVFDHLFYKKKTCEQIQTQCVVRQDKGLCLFTAHFLGLEKM